MKSWNRKQKLLASLAVVLIGAAGLLALRRLGPAALWFVPPCLIHSVLGWHCPSCGITRLLYSAMGGHFYAAFRMNPLLFLLLPLIGAWIFYNWAAWIWDKKSYMPPVWAIWTLLAVFILFGILRNIPYPPFAYLAPWAV
jgi:hypothetical protein